MSGQIAVTGFVSRPFGGLAIATGDRALELVLNVFGDLSIHDLVGHRRCTAVLDRTARHGLAVALLAAAGAQRTDDQIARLTSIRGGVGCGRVEVSVVGEAVLVSVFDAWGSSSRSIQLDVDSAQQLAAEVDAL